MNVDLPPSSAFAPDPAVARPRTARQPLTLTLPHGGSPHQPGHEVMSGSVGTGPAMVLAEDSLRAAVPRLAAVALTITF